MLDQFVGQTVGQCVVQQLVHHASQSMVYQAQQLHPRRPVAITVFLLPETLPLLASERVRTRFLQNAPPLIQLQHPHLLPLYGYGIWEGLPYLIAPYRSGGSLLSQLQQQGALSPNATVSTLEQVVAGLEYAHRQGKVHGALTPAHLLLSEQNTLQVAGLGLLHLLEKRGILPIKGDEEQFSSFAGTPLAARKYIAPEYLRGDDVTIRSDIYSLGVILLELLSGSLLGRDERPQEIVQGASTLPSPLIRVLLRALASDPARRFPRMNDLLVAWTAGIEQAASETISKRAPTVVPQTPAPTNPSTYQSQPPTTRSPAHETVLERTPSSVPSAQKPTYQSQPPDAQPPAGAWNAGPVDQGWPVLSPTPINYAPVDQPRARISQHLGKLGSIPRRRVTAVLATGLTIGLMGLAGSGLAQILTNGQAGQANAGMAGKTASGETIVGNTQQAVNTAQAFNDPAVQTFRQSLLIHLPNGVFVAFKQGCTHTGVLVNYDPQTHLLVCPAHGAIFDPANGASVVKGPAKLPLPPVAIHMYSDGSITAM